MWKIVFAEWFEFGIGTDWQFLFDFFGLNVLFIFKFCFCFFLRMGEWKMWQHVQNEVNILKLIWFESVEKCGRSRTHWRNAFWDAGLENAENLTLN